AGRRWSAPPAAGCARWRTSAGRCWPWPAPPWNEKQDEKGGILTMFRLMEPSDLAAMQELWAACRSDPADYAEKVIRRFAGEENAWLAEENGRLQALVLSAPVTLQGRPGYDLCGLCSRDEGAAAGLVDYVSAQLAGRGAVFLVAAPG